MWCPIRAGPHFAHRIITFEHRYRRFSTLSAIPPAICFCGFFFVCRLIMLLACSTRMRPVPLSTLEYAPGLAAIVRPAITFT